jgi:ATP-dependent Clp protease protease subunit
MKRKVKSLKNKFWNWVMNQNGRTLFLDGPIAEETWYGDEVTPKQFRAELISEEGDITIWINSPGGCVFAASQIYNMLMDYNGHVTVKIDGIAASAASVIAMAGSKVLMSPVALMMIHNPMTLAFGDTEEMQKAIGMLSEVKESILNAYEIKTGLSRTKLSHLMDAESWFNAKKAIELGFADGMLFESETEMMPDEGMIFSKMTAINSFIRQFPPEEKKPEPEKSVVETIPVNTLETRLNLIKP